MKRVGQGMRSNGAVFLHLSANKKLSPVVKVPYHGKASKAFPYRPVPVAPFCASTYVSISATCPDSCAFKRGEDGKHGGCYVDAGKTIHTIKRLDTEAEGLHGAEVIVAEADLLDRAFPAGMPKDGARGGRDLRLHVGGDVADIDSTYFLGAAATRWRNRGGGNIWTYTHRWQHIHREAFGPSIAVLASMEDPYHFKAARIQGYAPALVVPAHYTRKASTINGTRIIPCPAETGDTTCVECRLCLVPDALYKRKAGISFALHGLDRKHALVKLAYGQKKLL